MQLLAPYKSAKRQKQPYPRFLTHMRYRIETVFGQLVERFHAKRVNSKQDTKRRLLRALLFVYTYNLSSHLDKKQQIQYYAITVFNKIQQNSTKDGS